MKVLLTGSEGYIGTVLASILTAEGHSVTGVDCGFYTTAQLFRLPGIVPETIRKDIRDLTVQDLSGYDALVHMAELSNDPTGALNPGVTYEINHQGSVRLAQLAREAGISRFIYMSSCSVYGVASEAVVNENSALNPQTDYAHCKVMVERDVSPMANSNFSPVFLRNATVYGASPHLRFDLVLNNLCGFAWTTGEIKVLSDGTPWRPLVHVRDLCEVIRRILQAPREKFHNQIINVGSTDQNYTVRTIAESVAEVFTNCKLSFGSPGADNRSYRVAFDKLTALLPDFKCQWSARAGAEELLGIFSRTGLSKAEFEGRPWTRLKQLQFLRESGQIDERFFWAWDPVIRHQTAAVVAGEAK